MKFLTFIALLFLATSTNAQTLYSRAFGNNQNQPLIFIHGGPSSSSVYFEATTAQKLADKGFYVIIYDRRGEGRSVDPNARITYAEFFNDLNSIYKQYSLNKATLIGFSFGGLVTTLYAEKYPEKVNSIVLVSALISQQESYNTILQTTKAIYEQQGDTAKLNSIGRISRMDKNSVEYRDSIFKHATRNGYFTPKNPDSLAKTIYASYNTDPLITKYVKNNEAVHTLWKNESRKNINITNNLKNLVKKHIKIYALYGKVDGLYSIQQINDLKEIIGKDHLKYLDNCSHSVFIDQQTEFLAAFKEWLK
jgi:proline iminopeptidase